MSVKKTENNANEQKKLALTFEQAAAELDGIVTRLNSGSVQLDEMIALFERGTLLSEHCSALLNEYDGRIAAAMRQGDKDGE